MAMMAIIFVLVEEMSWFDSHCHLNGFLEKGILEEVLDRASQHEVSRMTAVGTTPEDWNVYRTLVRKYPERIFCSGGLHPSYVGIDWPSQVAELGKLWDSEPRPVAVGEIGLDYFRLPKDADDALVTMEQQRLAFSHQLSFAKERDLPVIVHSRNAFEDCLTLIDKSGVNWKKVVFHCFSEGVPQVEQLMERGGRASFTGILTFGKNDHLREAALRQGLENLMIETDSPYLAPEPKRGKVNEPAFLRHLGQFAAKLFDVTEDFLAERTFERTCDFYGV
ncbi:MAG: TatD family hydrolase [Opitutae bacterium]|jgi:TatD DNase family protein|nr:TatD family hydrolase [Opitutae bacterium]